MKAILALVLAAMLTACTTRTDYGDCIGAFDAKDPAYHYDLSVWNMVLAVVFFETIVVPIVVINDYTHCPVGKKDQQP